MTTPAQNLAPPRHWRWTFGIELKGSNKNIRWPHWSHKAKRQKFEREQTTVAAFVMLGVTWPKRVVFPVEVVITRYGKRLLDDDNATASASAVRDSIAEMLGITDAKRDPRATWRVDQRLAGVYGCEVEIRCVEVTP